MSSCAVKSVLVTIVRSPDAVRDDLLVAECNIGPPTHGTLGRMDDFPRPPDLPINPTAQNNHALVAAIREDIVASGGQITFARFMALALYHPEYGYYLAEARRPGRGGD